MTAYKFTMSAALRQGTGIWIPGPVVTVLCYNKVPGGTEAVADQTSMATIVCAVTSTKVSGGMDIHLPGLWRRLKWRSSVTSHKKKGDTVRHTYVVVNQSYFINGMLTGCPCSLFGSYLHCWNHIMLFTSYANIDVVRFKNWALDRSILIKVVNTCHCDLTRYYNVSK